MKGIFFDGVNMSYKDKAWLEREYAKKTPGNIASDCSVSKNTILYWLKRHGIKRRSPFEEYAKAFKG